MKREVFLYGEINKVSINKILKELLYFDSLSKEEITMYISSPGGSVMDGFLLIDTLQILKSPVKMVVLDCAASMAAIILACGAKRVIFPHAFVMLHEISGHLSRYDIMEQLEEQTLEILVKQIGKTKEEVAKLCSFENFLTAEEAKEIGIVDEIAA